MVALFKDNLTGQRFTRWTVLGRGTKPRHWLCICVCGATREVIGTNLRNGYSRSCGCLPKKHSDPKEEVNEEVNQCLVVQPIKVGESSAVMAAFRAAQIEGKSAVFYHLCMAVPRDSSNVSFTFLTRGCGSA
jgi:hypothetical protein